MGDMVSSSRTFFDFDFSAFIDNNFDMSSELFNNSSTSSFLSPTIRSPATTPALDDFLSQSDAGSVGSNTVPLSMSILHSNQQQSSYCNYENISPDILVTPALLQQQQHHHQQQTDLLVSQNHKLPPPSLSCIDTFIQNPDSDLVQLVQQNKDELFVFQSLISSSLATHLSVALPERAQNQKKRKSPDLQNSSPNKKVHTKDYTSYENNDDMNAQLLRELIKQTTNKRNHPTKELVIPVGYSPPKEIAQFTLTKKYSTPKIGYQQQHQHNNNNNTHSHHQYQQQQQQTQIYHARQYCGSNPGPQIPNLKRQNVPAIPYNIQTTNTKKTSKNNSNNNNTNNSANKGYHRSRPTNINNRPSMYSSDINPAQLLEIQAISRAQQDFIRAREQQEAEKELFLKLQKKS